MRDRVPVPQWQSSGIGRWRSLPGGRITRLICLLLQLHLLAGCMMAQSGSIGVNAGQSLVRATLPPTWTVEASSPTAVPESTATALPAFPSSSSTPTATALPTLTPTPLPTLTPTPLPTPVPDWYPVRPGDTLRDIAARHDISLETLLALNHMEREERLEVGRLIAVPSHITATLPPCYLAHDSEVVYGPSYLAWSTARFVEEQGGYLARYREGGRSGAEIIDTVAAKYHVGPRVLLAAMELLSGWVTEREPRAAHPFAPPSLAGSDLRAQASWAAKKLIQGYYEQLEGRRDWVLLSNGVAARLQPGSNPGSAAVATLLAATLDVDELLATLKEERFQKSYRRLFGEISGGHVRPPRGKQPFFALPWTPGEQWYFTGGPHGGYGDDESGWAALDFAPPVPSGCHPSRYPVRAIAPGLVIGSERGETWIDMDEDGDMRTGWVILYMHLATYGRVRAGTTVETGDSIGFPSCEGGHATGAHLHIARMYHGQWMPAGGIVPFQLGEWTAQATIGTSYDGLLRDGTGRTIESCNCRDPEKNRFPEP